MLFDFGKAADLNAWSELSDTVRSEGSSKATLDLYKTNSKRSAVLFTWLNPLPNGACFAGVRTVEIQWNLNEYQYVSFTCRSAGNATVYKIVLRHDGQNYEPYPSFEQQFNVSIYYARAAQWATIFKYLSGQKYFYFVLLSKIYILPILEIKKKKKKLRN